MTIYYAGLMRFLSSKDWPKSYACTYEAWDYSFSPTIECHAQDFFELFWVESGVGCHFINGERRRMETGYLALIQADDQHGFSAWEEGGRVSFINFAFRASLWHKIRDSFFPGKIRFFDIPKLAERELHLASDERERFRQMAFDLAAGHWSETNAAACLHGQLALLANRKHSGQAATALPEWLARATRMINSWPYFVGGVPEFIRLCGRSHEHASRDCRRLLNTTPRELVNNARLKWASMQLETTPKAIIDIAEQCGFENLGHFYKQFKAMYRATPRQYRLKFGITGSIHNLDK